mgnify:CR=1 FL=1
MRCSSAPFIPIHEEDIKEVKEMQSTCTDEWCQATEHVLDEIAKGLYNIHEPTFADESVNKRIKDMKRRVRELYATYKP